MTSQERAKKLAEATRLITEVRNSFSNEKEICECCGAERFVNWNERQQREQLNGAITRLKRVVDRINNTEGQTEWHPKPEQDEP